MPMTKMSGPTLLILVRRTFAPRAAPRLTRTMPSSIRMAMASTIARIAALLFLELLTTMPGPRALISTPLIATSTTTDALISVSQPFLVCIFVSPLDQNTHVVILCLIISFSLLVCTTDEDGIPDIFDQCPGCVWDDENNVCTAVAINENSKGGVCYSGCPDPGTDPATGQPFDTDLDGVPDCLDRCPGTYAPVGVE